VITRLLGFVLAIGVGFSPPVVSAGGAASTQSTPGKLKPASGTPPGKSADARASQAFVRATAAAEKARIEHRLDEAIDLYFKALKLDSTWTEGWWFLGTISYELDRYEPARDAFRRVVLADERNAVAWGLMGLSEFRLKEYDQALSHLLHARSLGLQSDSELAPVVRYHAAVLLTRNGEFDQALRVLNEFSVTGNDNPRVIESFGIATLRLPLLPLELPGEKRDAVMMAGRAQYFSSARMLGAAKQAFEQLVARYPETPNVHYAYGVFLMGEEPDLGLQELQKELKISPGHVWAMLQIAFEYIKRSEYEVAKSWAQQAVHADPLNFVARKAYGQVLLETGDPTGAISELEAGVKIAPDSPALRFQLAKAYQKAGRSADAARERAEFTRLDRLIRASRTGSQSVGGLEGDRAEAPESRN
jgi:tetratricopeptide (TPR) repeat protein